VVVDTSASVVPNGIKTTPIIEGSSVSSVELVNIPEPVASKSPPTAQSLVGVSSQSVSKELVTSLPLHERFSLVEKWILGLVLLTLFVSMLLWNLSLQRRLKQISSPHFERNTPHRDPRPQEDGAKSSAQAHAPASYPSAV
jgi:hypothetical protein